MIVAERIGHHVLSPEMVDAVDLDDHSPGVPVHVEVVPTIRPAAGNVRTQATTIERAMPQRTAEILQVAPEPMIAEVMTCVVETGACQMNAVA